VAERIGPDFAYWLDAPYELALWCWHQLQERDRVRRWFERAGRLELAELQSLGTHAPKRLQDERDRLYAAARGRNTPTAEQEEVSRGQALARRITRALSRGS
jgi:hypothetical protein